MAWIFSLSAECKTKAKAIRFSNYFQTNSWKLADGATITITAEVMKDSERNWWCMVAPKESDVIENGTIKDTQRLSEMYDVLYSGLRGAPDFRYALVGLEVDLFRTFHELLEEQITLELQTSFPGLVLAESIWIRMGSPNGFSPFRPGFVWIPYVPPKK